MDSKERKPLFTSRYIVTLAILVALVVVFQIFGSYIKIGATSLSFVLVPIVLGGIILGVIGGAILGFAFSLIVMIMGFTGLDPFTNVLLMHEAAGTIATIFIKGILAGVIPALVYKAIAKKNKTVGVIVAAILAPIINTGIFIICMLIMSNVLVAANFVADSSAVLYFLVIVCAGINFLVELTINVVLAPALNRVINALRFTV